MRGKNYVKQAFMYLSWKKNPKKPIALCFPENDINFRKIWPWPLHPRKFPKLQNGHLLSKWTHHTVSSPTPLQNCFLPCEISSDKPYQNQSQLIWEKWHLPSFLSHRSVWLPLMHLPVFNHYLSVTSWRSCSSSCEPSKLPYCKWWNATSPREQSSFVC